MTGSQCVQWFPFFLWFKSCRMMQDTCTGIRDSCQAGAPNDLPQSTENPPFDLSEITQGTDMSTSPMISIMTTFTGTSVVVVTSPSTGISPSLANTPFSSTTALSSSSNNFALPIQPLSTPSANPSAPAPVSPSTPVSASVLPAQTMASSSSSTQSAPAPPETPSLRVSVDARCGSGTGQTCEGSTWGNCCSRLSYCGRVPAYCGTGCQSGFGRCGV